MIIAVLGSVFLTGQEAADDPCVIAKASETAEARAHLFAPDARFGELGGQALKPPFGIRESLDGVSAQRGGNDRHELSFRTMTCRGSRDAAELGGVIRHDGWSNEPGTGEAYPAVYEAPFRETWRLEAGAWRITVLEVGPFEPGEAP